MQALIDALRTTGARQPILFTGLANANDLSGWLANEPDDPAHQVAAWHGYPDNACNNRDCWERTLGALSARVPVVASEVGGEVCSAGSLASRRLPYLDAKGISYLGWTGDSWQQCSKVLILN